MQLRYLRNQIFTTFLRPVSDQARERRMKAFSDRIPLREGLRVLDLGGQPQIWQNVRHSLHITILNLPGVAVRDVPSHHELEFVEGDGCNVEGFADQSFDLVFSNSVIEHVGPRDRQAAFADEVRRLGKSYWVQTPAIWFPVEAHSGMPFWWFYPAPVRAAIIERWRVKLPDWTEMVEETRVLARKTLVELFPGAQLYVERVAGIPKSYCVYSCPS
jgi:hypothetical protein